MKINQFLWENYKETKSGQEIINLFKQRSNNSVDELFKRYVPDYHDANDLLDFIESSLSSKLSAIHTFEQAEVYYDDIIDNGIILEDTYFINTQDYENVIYFIPYISLWLYYKYPNFFKPYFFMRKFFELKKIADCFSFDLPTIPLKRYKRERAKYYLDLCRLFSEIQTENNFTDAEFCAFLYDYAPKFIGEINISNKNLPQPTQAWIVGGDKYGVDFEFLDNAQPDSISRWQGNIDTKRDDIVIMYCLSPRSYIHSIWQATTDGIADPFFLFYGSMYIGNGIKVPPLHISEIKSDEYFSRMPLVRRNLQGINGCSFTAKDYEHLLYLFSLKGFDTEVLPKLYNPQISINLKLNHERDVELQLVEPFLKNLGYSEKDWIRQMPVRMGRGERNYPDYAFFANHEIGYESAKMLLETKYHIKTNFELEEAFKQARSYAMRLDSKILIICDKNSISIYKRINGSFDRAIYTKKYWEEINNPDIFKELNQMIGRRMIAENT